MKIHKAAYDHQYRVIILTLGAPMARVGEVAQASDPNTYMFFVGGDPTTGKLTPEQEGILTQLRATELLNTALVDWGVENKATFRPNRDMLLNSLQKLADETKKTLEKLPCAVECTSAPVGVDENYPDFKYEQYSDDPRLSLSTSGQKWKGLWVDKCRIHRFEHNEMDGLLNWLCAWSDVGKNLEAMKAKYKNDTKTVSYAKQMLQRAERGRRAYL